MSFIVNTPKSNAPNCPGGTHLARLIQIIDLGTHYDEFTDGKTGAVKARDVHKVRLVFETPSERAVFKQDGSEEPFVLGRNFTMSLHEKSSLYKFVCGILGRKLTDAETASFDLESILGKACLITVVEYDKQGGGKSSRIESAGPLMKGQECPPAYGKVFAYTINEGQTSEKFQVLPEWLQKEIAASKELSLSPSF